MLWALLSISLASNPYLPQARAAVQALKYDEAVRLLRIAREVPESTFNERREVDDLLARSLAAQGKSQEAEQVYAELLQRDPYAPNPLDAAPKIRALFVSAKTRVYPKPAVALRVRSSTATETVLEVFDPWDVVSRVDFREGRSGVPVTQHQVTAPHGVLVVALDEDGAELARGGPYEAPAKVSLTPAAVETPPTLTEGPQRSLTGRVLGLTGTGVGAISIGAGVVMAFISSASWTAADAQPDANGLTRSYELARSQAIAANVLIGAGIAVAIAGILTLVLAP